ncbi:hypothetical protein JMJ77_0006644, partial [Colletotrichum scovillei]
MSPVTALHSTQPLLKRHSQRQHNSVSVCTSLHHPERRVNPPKR